MFAIVTQILAWGPGAINAIAGGGFAKATKNSKNDKEGEIQRLRTLQKKVFSFIQQLGGAGSIDLDSRNDKVYTDGGEKEEALKEEGEVEEEGQKAEELSDLSLIQKCVKILNSEGSCFEDLGELHESSQETLKLALEVYQRFIARRLEHEDSAAFVDKENIKSAIAQGVSGLGQMAAKACSTTAHVAFRVLSAIAAGLSLISSIFVLSASVNGMVSTKRELIKNRVRQIEVEQAIKAAGASQSELMCDSVLKGLVQELSRLKKEKELLTTTYRYHYLNALGALFCIVASALILTGTSGAGVLVLTVLGAILPLIATVYKAYSFNDAFYIRQLKKDITTTPAPPIKYSQLNVLPFIPNSVITPVTHALTILLSARNDLSRSKIQKWVNEQASNINFFSHVEALFRTLSQEILQEEADSMTRAAGQVID